jgi:16S rRNA (cytidine1402-2'-O)-methyltransferase
MFDFVKALLQTKNVAIVSDAGMPCISDPGWKLVDKIR